MANPDRQSPSWNHGAKMEPEGERYRSLFDHNPNGVYSLDRMGRLVEVNPSLEALTGYAAGELIGRSSVRIIAPEDRRRAAERFSEASRGEPLYYEISIVRKDGERRDIHVTQTPIIVDGEVEGVYGITKDITERVKMEETLRETEGLYRALIERTPMVTYTEHVVDGVGVSTYISPQIEQLLGYPPGELDDREPYWGLLHPDDRDLVLALDGRANETGEPFSAEYRMIHRDGSVVWVRDDAALVSRSEDGTQHWQGLILDVTGRREAEERQREAETLYRTLVEQIPAVTYVDRADGSFKSVYTSPQIEELLGYTPEEWRTGELWEKRLHPDDRERILAADDVFEEEGGAFNEEYRLIHRDGSVVWVREEAAVLRDETGEPLYWQGIILDITRRRKAERALRKSEASLAEAQRLAHLGSWEWNPRSGRLYWSDETFRIYGLEPGELVPTFEKFIEIVHPDERNMLREAIRAALYEGAPYDIEHRIVRPGGEVRMVHRRAEVVRDERGEPIRMVGSVHDITERKVLERRLRQQALHDPLTGLPNRTLFTDRLGQALKRAERREGRVAVMFLDLDNFKYINDSMGHEAGDRLIVAVAGRLRALLRPEDTLARLGGDEFVAILEDISDRAQAIRVVERVGKGLRVPMFVDQREVFTTASIGVAFSGDDGERAEDLIRDADAAMYRAKRSGKDHHAVFRPEMKGRSSARRPGLEDDLRRALRRPADEFRIHYQPKALVGTGDIIGVEALLRWDHPDRGMVFPPEFMPVAEETGMIVPLGRWVIEEACRQAGKWRTEHPETPDLSVTVNLSARQFRDPDLVSRVAEVLDVTGLSPDGLCLEVSEGAVMEDAISALETLGGLKDLGVRLAIDDFGTGYSSLGYLKRFPVDAINVDRSIISGLGKDAGDTAIVSAMITLAHALTVKVVAEGVETETEADELRSLGCDLAQGYYFWRPMPAEEVSPLLFDRAAKQAAP